jgi:hypothetical protein
MGGWYRVLTRSLQNLKARNSNGFAITVTRYWQQLALPPREFESLQHKIRFDMELCKLQDPDSYAVRILHAISESRCSVSELALPDTSWEFKLEQFSMFDCPGSTIVDSCMSCIRLLDLTIDTNRLERPSSWSGLAGC